MKTLTLVYMVVAAINVLIVLKMSFSLLTFIFLFAEIIDEAACYCSILLQHAAKVSCRLLAVQITQFVLFGLFYYLLIT